jgi:23S rRNA pseudouridine1911/1915/1917 synthase
VHLASIGHPLLGDPVYGGRAKASVVGEPGLRRQALHATCLELDHPATGKRMRWDSPLPADLLAVLSALRAQDKR